MSALAGLLKEKGFAISGSDSNTRQKSIKKLTNIGCRIVPPEKDFLQELSPDLVVYSSAIKKDSPLLQEAERLEIPLWHRAELLAEISKEHKTIAITGAHGKTTTSAMISEIFFHAEQDPSSIIGGFVESIDSNYRAGNGPFFIAEADESDRSMLKLFPNTIVITNIDREHLDTYTGPEDMQNAFFQFLQKLPDDGKALIFFDNHYTQQLIQQSPKEIRKKIITYGRSEKADFQITEESHSTEGSNFSIQKRNSKTIKIALNKTGSHWVENATAAYVTATLNNLSDEAIKKTLKSFAGIEQRFTTRGFLNQAEIIDDYAHHPTEINHAIAAACFKKPKRLIVIFQPQRYSRTKALWKEFINVFTKHSIDQIFITDIYSASEKNIDSKITARNLVQEININTKNKNAEYISQENNYQLIKEKIYSIAQPGDIILFLGAGKVNQIAQILTDQTIEKPC